MAVFVLLDPYDTGLMSLFNRHGVTEKGGRVGNASRIHDEEFDSAVFGNSHIMPINTERLSDATGLKIMMLGIQGTGVPEQTAMLDAYLRRHSRPKAVIIGVDFVYCTADPHVQPMVPFPYWLYDRNPLTYVGHLFQAHTFEVLGRRRLVLFGHGGTQLRNGNIDIYQEFTHTPEQASKIINSVPPQDFSNEKSMPGFAMLDRELAKVPAETAVLLVLPPVISSALPPAGTPAAQAEQTCKQHAFDLAKGRPNVRVLDWRKVTPETEDIRNFWDPAHYYDAVSRPLERDIASALLSLRSDLAAATSAKR